MYRNDVDAYCLDSAPDAAVICRMAQKAEYLEYLISQSDNNLECYEMYLRLCDIESQLENL